MSLKDWKRKSTGKQDYELIHKDGSRIGVAKSANKIWTVSYDIYGMGEFTEHYKTEAKALKNVKIELKYYRGRGKYKVGYQEALKGK